MLGKEDIRKIEDFVKIAPRTIQEVAVMLGRNWRTADSYVERIAREEGTVATKVFREGTRGALKIVYYRDNTSIHSSQFQERLLQKIQSAHHKTDFSPFDIYQYIEEGKRRAFYEEQTEYKLTEKQDLEYALRSTQEQVLIFSGNLSWALVTQGNTKIIDVFDELVARNVSIKVVANVQLDAIDNIKAVLALNHKYKKNLIEVRHAEQPLRSFVIDKTFMRFKEEKAQKRNSRLYIFYEIRDEEWIAWMQKVFWHFFHMSIDAESRIKDLETIEEIK
ncbi:hypothetical protein K9M74_00120 [Candidatus Woesearchaeota archaeon]|nr:hypothetical protein [Candidatus Woesearchaeota archaeon]